MIIMWEKLYRRMRDTYQPEDVSVDIPMLNRRLASSMKEKLCQNSPYSSDNCIFRVPEKLRRNKNVFDPNIISIGPYHHGKPELAPMEKIKAWYLQHLLQRLQLPPEENLELFVESVRELQTSARGCYAEPIELDDDRFVEMLIVDGCFLIELFRKDTWLVQQDKDDPIFNASWMQENLYNDLILLENQIPWSVLLELFKLTETAIPPCNEEPKDVLAKSVLKFFETMMLLTEPAEYRGTDHDIRHILDLLLSCLLSFSPNKKPEPVDEIYFSAREELENTNFPVHDIRHILDLLRKRLPSFSANKKPENPNFELFPPVTDLLRAGVKFKKGTPGDILNIKFSSGVFEIPPIKIQGNSESLFRNLIAYEQCDYHCEHQFTSYAVFMDCLVNASRDADLLCEKKIVVHSLSTKDISLIFDRLYNDTLVTKSCYGGLSHKVNNYYTSKWCRWRTALKTRYFNNPWSIFSFIAAVLILVFTFTQTLFSILSY